MKRFVKRQSGFTLVEIMMAVAIFSILAYGITFLVGDILTSSSRQSSLLAGSDQARRLAFQMMKELRNAATSSTGGYALQDASPQQIIFYSNLDTGPDIERVRYFLQTQKLYKGVVKPSGNPLTYDLATETLTVVQNDVANGSNPVLYYYDGNYDGVTDSPLANPVSVTAVKYVKLNLQIFNKGGRSGTNTYTVTAGGTVRNLKTNLGN